MIDTNIFISAALFPKGRAAEALYKTLASPYQPVVCDYVIDELHRNVDGSDVRVVNSAVYALMRFQEQMGGEGEKVGLFSEEDVESWITQSRRKENIV